MQRKVPECGFEERGDGYANLTVRKSGYAQGLRRFERNLGSKLNTSTGKGVKRLVHFATSPQIILQASLIASLSSLAACDWSTTDDSESAKQTTSQGAASSDGAVGESAGGGRQSGVGADNDTTGSMPGEKGGDPAADNVPQGAKDLGALSTTLQSFGPHHLSEDDQIDYFRFEVPQFGKTVVRLKKEHDASVSLVLTSANPNADQGRVIIDPWQSVRNHDHAVALPKGAYFLALRSSSSAFIPYELSMVLETQGAPEPQPEPGNHFDEAQPIGNLESGNVNLHGYVGTLDHADFYEFTAPANRRIKVSPADLYGYLGLRVFKKDGVSGELLKGWDVSESSPDEREIETKEGGVFYLRVGSQSSEGSMYRILIGLM